MQNIGERSILNIALVLHLQVRIIFQCGNVFLKGKRQHLDLNIAAGEKGCQLAGQHIGVRACDIHIAVWLDKKTIHSLLKVWNCLYFINEDIIHFVRDQTFLNQVV